MKTVEASLLLENVLVFLGQAHSEAFVFVLPLPEAVLVRVYPRPSS